MEDEITFDLSIEDFLYQRFLLEICKICDDIYSTEKKVLEIPFDEKQKMAEEMLEFVAFSLSSLKSSLIRIKKQDFEKRIEDFSRILNKKAKKDIFAKFVLLNYVLKGRVKVKEIPRNLAIATFVLLTKGKKTNLKNLERKIKKIKPFVLRVAALVSPFVELYQKLQEEVKKGNIRIEMTLRKGKIDKEALRYIG